MRALRLTATLLLLGVASCSDDSQPVTPTPDRGPSGLAITITAPKEGATDVSVSKPVLKATFTQALKNAQALTAVLLKDGKELYGLKKYSATNLEVIFTPFNLLESRTKYTFRVAAEGVQAEVTFTTEKANEGTLPPVAGVSYDFRIKEITYPEEIGAAFNPQLPAAPPVVMHVVEVKPEADKDGNSFGSLTMVGATGSPTDAKGQAKVLPEDATHLTTTAMSFQGRLEGRWFGMGPTVLHTTASGVPLVIRDFLATGLFTADGTNMEGVRITGLIDPAELGKSLGGNIDLSFICTDPTLGKYCDETKRVRIAASIETVANPTAFNVFITSPVNASLDVDPATSVQIYFSGEADQTATTAKLTDAAAAAIPGKLTWASGKIASFKPDAALSAKTKYTLEVVGVAKADATKDTRHLTFTTR